MTITYTWTVYNLTVVPEMDIESKHFTNVVTQVWWILKAQDGSHVADTIGIVVERARRPGELDGFIWYCERCGAKLHEEFLELHDIEADLPPVFERFHADERHRTCKACGWMMPPRGA